MDFLPSQPYKTRPMKVFLLIFITLISIEASADPDWMDCPCNCKWSSGKKTAICSSSGFTEIPTLNSDLQVLDLQNNLIEKLNKDAFSATGLLNLQKIFMKNTTLKEVDRDSFKDLKILIEVDLSYNRIAEIQRGTFSGNDRLKILYLSGNPLKILYAEQFPALPHLRILEMNECQIHTIYKEAFMHLAELENLSLKSNQLINSSKYIYMPIRKLKSLDLFGNPWRCDCKLRNFRNWYLDSNLHSTSLTCNEPPNYKGRIWEDISSPEFACPPEVETDRSLVRGESGDNVTLGCYVKGDPEPEVTWVFNGHPLGSINGSRFEQGFAIDVERNLSEKSVNLHLYNITNSDVGEYVCQAKSIIEIVSKNVTLLLNNGYLRSIHDANFIFLVLVVLLAVFIVIFIVVSAFACTCMSFSRKRRRKINKNKKIKGSQSFYEQEKHLLDMSTSNTEQQSRKSSFEMLSSNPSMELLKHSVSMPAERFEPVHYINRMNGTETTTIIPLNPSSFSGALKVFPPPAEFSNPSISHSGTLGNIYISVSLTQDPNIVDRYPDLLDHRSGGQNSSEIEHSSSFCGLSVAPYATLPRKQLKANARSQESCRVIDLAYDNMGKRVTVGGNSTLSLPDEHDEIPPPPPPPLSCKPDSNDFIPL